jgi:hypothetical protein
MKIITIRHLFTMVYKVAADAVVFICILNGASHGERWNKGPLGEDHQRSVHHGRDYVTLSMPHIRLHQ